MALSRLIEREALVVRANADGLATDPTVQRHMKAAADRVLEDANLHHATDRIVTDRRPVMPTTGYLTRGPAKTRGGNSSPS